MTADAKMELIKSALESGRIVLISTATRTVRITPSAWAVWQRRSPQRPMIYVSRAGSLRMREGRGYVSADYCSINVVDR